MFVERNFTTSPVNVTQGERLSSDNMKGRVYTVNLGDLNTKLTPNKKIKLVVDEEESKGSKVALTNFYGLDTTRDHLSSLIKKWHTLIESFVDAKTSDGFLLRLFIFAITKGQRNQQRATSYAQKNQIKQIRKIIHTIVSREVKKTTLRELVPKLLNTDITKEIANKASKIFPVQSVLIRKVKTIKRPRFDSKLI
jgi:small subunit ribosomal protein S3Ae